MSDEALGAWLRTCATLAVLAWVATTMACDWVDEWMRRRRTARNAGEAGR